VIKAKFLTLMTLTFLGYSGIANAQSATANFNANAQIVEAITLANTTALNFGNLIPGTGGTADISAAGVRSVTGAVVAAGGTVSAATFNVTGTPSVAYTIALPPTANLTGPGSPMAVTFSAAQITGGSLSRTITAGGTDTFNSGGTLTVGNAQTAGSYSGVFTMTVAY
jgi:hypothetical protein